MPSTAPARCVARADHPRACGEHPPTTGRRPRAQGITPALAGSTHHLRCRRGRGRDHPRACGEHRSRTLLKRNSPGSPPRLRGAPQVGEVESSATRITPALAGSTELLPLTDCGTGDHPRACGEHCHESFCFVHTGGSPPRLRGARAFGPHAGWRGGITPALAGSTFSRVRHGWFSRDHPRACGEHNHGPHHHRARSGSPPRLRGAPFVTWDDT